MVIELMKITVQDYRRKYTAKVGQDNVNISVVTTRCYNVVTMLMFTLS